MIDRNDTNENPLIKNEDNPSELRPPAKTPTLKSSSCRQDNDPPKYRSHNNFPNARKQKTFQSPSKNIRCKGDPSKISTRNVFYYLDPRAKDPLEMRSSLI